MKTWIVGAGVVLVSAVLQAAPFAKWFQVDTSGGETRIWGEGDDFSAVFESESGWTILFSKDRRAYVYANKDKTTGGLTETDIELGREKGREAELADIAKHLRDESTAAENERERRILADEQACGTRGRWREMKARAQQVRAAVKSGLMMAPPNQPTIGKVKGLTLLIDFPIAGSSQTLRQQKHPSVTKEQLEALINGDSCTYYGNASSVRSYYKDVSCGRLDYSNVVLGWFLAKHPREYYDNPMEENGPSARELIGEVLQTMATSADYETYYLPLLKQLSHSGSSFTALNVWFAGPEAAVWSKGLWAHKWVLDSANYNKLKVNVDGISVHFREYQISPVTRSPSIGTFCHENGHMVCDFPDLYNYEYGNGNGLGDFSLMSSSGEKNPVCVDAYLRVAAGWVTPKELTVGSQTVAAELDDVWKWTNPDDNGQYFLIENRRRSGRDSGIPGSGVLILRCDESGDNTAGTFLSGYSGMAKYRMFNEASIEQADGQYHIEQRTPGRKDGEQQDLWYAGNPASGYGGVFSDDSKPCALWRDRNRSGLKLSAFSAAGEVMTFTVEDTTPVGTLEVSVKSASYDAAGGTGSFTVTGSGSWQVEASDPWITLTKSSGSKTEVVEYAVQANSTTARRIGEIKVIQKTLVKTVDIQQAGKAIVSGHFQLDGTTLLGWDGKGPTDVEIPAGVTKIADNAFSGTAITSVVLPDSVTEIGTGAFSLCYSLHSFRFGRGLKKLGGQAFFADRELVGLMAIPEGVQEIGYCAFYDTGIEWFILPKSLTKLGWGVFDSCKVLSRVYFRGNAPQCGTAYMEPEFFVRTPDGMTVFVPFGSTGWHSSASTTLPETWPEADGENARRICNYSLSEPQIELPVTLEKLGCREVKKELKVRASESWSVSRDVKWITLDRTSGNGFGVVQYTLSANTSSAIRIGHVSVSSGTVAQTLTIEQYGAGKEGLEHFEIADGVLLKWDGEGPTDIVIPSGAGITAIGEEAFYCRGNLTSVVLPDDVVHIGNDAFGICHSLTNVVFGSRVREIGAYAFVFDSALTGDLRLPDTLKTTGYHAFWECGYTSVSLPGGMTELGGGAFEGSPNLLAVLFRGNAPEQVGYSFRENMTEVFAGTSDKLQVYVPVGSKGWNSEAVTTLPAKWPVGDGDDMRPLKSFSGYIVRFLPNGGNGAEYEIDCRPGAVSVLPKNRFTRAGFDFDGWIRPNGRRYDDGLLIFNLGAFGDFVPMAAIWK